MDNIIAQSQLYINSLDDTRIVLLKQPGVIQWLYGDLSYLPSIIETKNKTTNRKLLKEHEDKWGQTTLKVRRPDLKLGAQWTNKFGEHLVEELYMLLGKTLSKPMKIEGWQPDSEIEDAILEAKAETFMTDGTAGEKILGTPFKYSKVPRLWGKPLKIVCLGGAEKAAREDYGSLPGIKCVEEKVEFLEFFKSKNIEYIGATDILRSLLDTKPSCDDVAIVG